MLQRLVRPVGFNFQFHSWACPRVVGQKVLGHQCPKGMILGFCKPLGRHPWVTHQRAAVTGTIVRTCQSTSQNLLLLLPLLTQVRLQLLLLRLPLLAVTAATIPAPRSAGGYTRVHPCMHLECMHVSFFKVCVRVCVCVCMYIHMYTGIYIYISPCD